MNSRFCAIRQKMEDRGVSEAAIRAFENAFQELLSDDDGLLPEERLEPARDLLAYENLEKTTQFDPELLSQTVVIKLNGGLGTSMGLQKPKSLLEVKPGANFLDLIARQILHLRSASGARVRLLLMNSEASTTDTRAHLQHHAPQLGTPDELELLQNWAPKLRQDDFNPVSWPANPELEWCPPGHGDLYAALLGRGKLAELRQAGVRYAFVSNGDNLGALLDATLLSHFARSQSPFMMEVTRRTPADKKGGHLATRRDDGQLVLREVAQCPASDLDAFQDIDKHRYFNTNNLWVNLDALAKQMEKHDGLIPLPVIRNRKTVDPRDPDSTPVVQLEVAMGAAIESFPGASAVVVPRSRFAPVKATSDLLVLRSDAYQLTEAGHLVLDPRTGATPPIVSLSPPYKLLDSLSPLGLPSLCHAQQLTVEGPLHFAPGVVVHGHSTFTNPSEERTEVAPGTYENTHWRADAAASPS